MSVVFVPCVLVKHFSPTVIFTMAPNGAASKDTTERNIGEAVEQTPVDFSVYVNTQLFIENGSTLTWQQVNSYRKHNFGRRGIVG